MRKLQKGDLISLVICEWVNVVFVTFMNISDTQTVDIYFSRLVIEDNSMKIEGVRGSGPIYVSLLKSSNARWFVDEVIY